MSAKTYINILYHFLYNQLDVDLQAKKATGGSTANISYVQQTNLCGVFHMPQNVGYWLNIC